MPTLVYVGDRYRRSPMLRSGLGGGQRVLISHERGEQSAQLLSASPHELLPGGSPTWLEALDKQLKQLNFAPPTPTLNGEMLHAPIKPDRLESLQRQLAELDLKTPEATTQFGELNQQVDHLMAQCESPEQRAALAGDIPESFMLLRSQSLEKQVKDCLSQHREGAMDDRQLNVELAGLFKRVDSQEQLDRLQILAVAHKSDQRCLFLRRQVIKIMRNSQGLPEDELKAQVFALCDHSKPMEVAYVCSLVAAYRALRSHFSDQSHA